MKRGFFQIIIHLKAAKVASLLEYSNDYELDRFINIESEEKTARDSSLRMKDCVFT